MKHRLFLPVLLSSSFVACLPAAAAAQAPRATRLVVRVVAHDAKIIGSGVGGARVTVRDLDTGAELASGIQEGGTGSTERIVGTPRARDAQVFDTDGAAAFRTTLDLVRPTRIEVTAEGPLGTEQALQRTSTTLLMVPGQDIEGEGLVLELHGFRVEIQEPAGGSPTTGSPLQVRAKVTMLCGCPTEPGGLWDADRIDVRATVVDTVHDRVVAEVPLSYAGKRSLYSGSLPSLTSGSYELRVVAVEPERANAGMASVELTVR